MRCFRNVGPHISELVNRPTLAVIQRPGLFQALSVASTSVGELSLCLVWPALASQGLTYWMLNFDPKCV